MVRVGPSGSTGDTTQDTTGQEDTGGTGGQTEEKADQLREAEPDVAREAGAPSTVQDPLGIGGTEPTTQPTPGRDGTGADFTPTAPPSDTEPTQETFDPDQPARGGGQEPEPPKKGPTTEPVSPAPGSEEQIDRITDPTGQSGTPTPPGEVLTQQELQDRGVGVFRQFEINRQVAEQYEGVEAGDVAIRERGGQLYVGLEPQGDVPEAGTAPLELRRARTTGRLEAAKRETVGAGIGRFPGEPTAADLQAQEAVQASEAETEALGQAREATPGAGIGLTQQRRELRQAEQRAAEQFVGALGEQLEDDDFSVAGFERGDEFTIERRQADPVGRALEAITSGELLRRGVGPVAQSVGREFQAAQQGTPIIEPELTPTGRERFTSQVLLSRGKIEGREETLDLGPLNEITAELGGREIKTPEQLEFDEEGELVDVSEAPEVLNVGQGTVAEQAAKGTLATLYTGAEGVAAVGEGIQDVTYPIVDATTAIPSPTNPLGVFAPEETKQFSTTIQKGVIGGATDIFRAPEVGLDVTRVGTEAAIYTGERVAEEGAIEGIGTAAAAGAGVAARLGAQAAVAASQQPIRTGGALLGGATVGTALSPVRVSRFDVPVEGGGTATLRGVRLTAPKILESRIDAPGRTVGGLREGRPVRGTPSVTPERIDFERIGEYGPEIDPTGRFETDVLRTTAGRISPEARARFEAAESVAEAGARTSPGLQLTRTEDIVAEARDVPEGAAGPVAEALQDVDAEIFGSAAVRSQLPEARTPRDVDIAVEDKSAAKQRLGEALEGTDAEVSDVFDIKEKSELPRPGEVAKFGRLAQERLETEEGVRVTQAGEELLKKAGGSVFLRPRGRPAPDAPGEVTRIDVGPGTRGGGTFVRVKDPADVGVIGAGMARTTGLGRVSPFARRRARKRGQRVERFREEFAPELEASVAEQPEIITPRPFISRSQLRRLASEERAQVTLSGRLGEIEQPRDTGIEPRDREIESSVSNRADFDPETPFLLGGSGVDVETGETTIQVFDEQESRTEVIQSPPEVTGRQDVAQTDLASQYDVESPGFDPFDDERISPTPEQPTSDIVTPDSPRMPSGPDTPSPPDTDSPSTPPPSPPSTPPTSPSTVPTTPPTVPLTLPGDDSSQRLDLPDENGDGEERRLGLAGVAAPEFTDFVDPLTGETIETERDLTDQTGPVFVGEEAVNVEPEEMRSEVF